MSLDDVHLQTVRFHFAKLAIPETVPVGVSRIGVGRCGASFRLKAIPRKTSGGATDGGGRSNCRHPPVWPLFGGVGVGPPSIEGEL